MSDPAPELPDLEEEDSGSPLRAFFGLFVVPLIVVLICVGVFVGFGWIAYDHQDIDDYLNDLRSSWRPRRAARCVSSGPRRRRCRRP